MGNEKIVVIDKDKDIDKIKKSVGETEIAEIITALGLNGKGGE